MAPVAITLPNGEALTASLTTSIDLALPRPAQTAHIVPGLAETLLSVGQLCDVGCTVTFRKRTATVWYKHHRLLTVPRHGPTGLWKLPLSQLLQHVPHPVRAQLPQRQLTAAAAVNPRAPIAQRVAFYHAICFSPALTTWIQAIDKGFFTTFPELTSAMVRKHPPPLRATIMGHLDQERANQRSTQPKSHRAPANCYTRPLQVHMTQISTLRTAAYADATGRFLVPSSRGHSYVLVVYDVKANYIFARPITSRRQDRIHDAFKDVYELLIARGLHPALAVVDNEASQTLKSYIHSTNSDIQLVPPDQHRTNKAERAIRTFKNHFIAGLSSMQPDFPLHLWDRLLPQAEITLNLLRASNINPRLSAYAQVHGAFDFNRTPLGIPGAKVLVHEKPTHRETWAPHATEAIYIGPAMEHYRCFRVYVPGTHSERITDSLSWLPSAHLLPTASSTDAACAAASDLIRALQHPSAESTLSPLHDNERQALATLAIIFANRFTDTPALLPHMPVSDPATTHQQAAEPRVGPTPGEPAETAAQPPLLSPQPDLRLIVADARPTFAEQSPTNDQQSLQGPPTTATPTTATPTTTYATYNHNGPQRRRQQRRQSQHKPGLKPPGQQPHQPLKPSAPLPNLHNPIVTASPPAQMLEDDATVKTDNRRKSRRGHLALRFDPKTHRPIRLDDAPQPTRQVSRHQAMSAMSTHRQLVKGVDGHQWVEATAREFGRLAQGLLGHVAGTDTIFFIRHADKPKDKKASYCRVVCEHNELKPEPYRVRLTIGGDQIEYPGYLSTPTVDTTTVKILFNDVVSTPRARFMTLDIKNFYLNTPLDRYEYMRIPVSIIPPAIMQQYNLDSLVEDGYVMVEIRKGIYGLPQAGILAYNLLVERLATAGYHPAPHTPGLFTHETRDIKFVLWVDDFGIRYTNKADAQHLIEFLQQWYEIKSDHTGGNYLGLTLQWDYKNRTVDISMPGYIERALERFHHPHPTKPQHAPHSWQPPTYGSGPQLTDIDESPPLQPHQIKRIQQIVGVLLYYARMVDNTMLVAINTIAAAQAKGTEATLDAVTQLLNYAATHPTAVVRYKRSDMILYVSSDASYLSAPEARSRLGGYFFLSQKPHSTAPPTPTDPPPPFNGPILVNSSIMNAVLSSAAEAELGAIFYNAKEACAIRNTLTDLGHPQPATPIQVDNACAVGLANQTVKQKRSKAIDMRFYWIQDRVRDGQFLIYWQKGLDNDADYFTKHHSPAHHRVKRSRYLHTEQEQQ